MEPRFFIAILPQVYLVLGIGISEIYDEFEKIISRHVLNSILIGCAIFMGFNCIYNLNNNYAFAAFNYRGVAEYLLEQPDIYAEDTAVTVITWGSTPNLIDGFKEFYLTKKGTIKNVNTINPREINLNNEKEILKYNKIYICTIQGEYLAEQNELLNKHYKLLERVGDIDTYIKK